MDDVQAFIESVLALDSNLKQKCLNGRCYKFHLLLAQVFSGAEPYMNGERDHVVTRIGNNLYDITGKVGSVVGKASERYHRMDETEVRVAEKWGS